MFNYIACWRDGFEVIWRNLTWVEYRKFKRRYEQSLFEKPMAIALEIYKLVRIQGPDPKFIPAGIPGYICEQQMLNNPFSGRYEDVVSSLEAARRVVTGDYMLSAKALIAATLNYKPEEIDQWDPNIFFVRLAQAEIACGRTFDPVDPNAPIPINTKGNPNKKIQRQLTSSQQKAIDRVRTDRSRDWK